MQAQLIPVDGGDPVGIDRDITIVGRKPELCDLTIEHGSVSKLHCVIVKTDGLLFIRDLVSTNGTKVNGQKVTCGALLPGDELAFAKVRFRVHLGPSVPVEVGANQATEMLTSFPDLSDGEEGLEIELEPLESPDAVQPVIIDLQRDSESDVRLLPDDSVV